MVGLLFYFFNPQIYLNYLERSIVNFYLSIYLNAPRLHSFVGSSIVGVIVPSAIAFLVFEENKNIKRVIYIPIFILTSLLTMQRAAWGSLIIIIILYIFNGGKNKRAGLFASAILIAFLVILLATPSLLNPLLEFFGSRGFSFSQAVSERNSGWSQVFRYGLFTIIGHGLGTGGHRVMNSSAFHINDGYYFRSIYEIGIVGATLFWIIMIYAVFKAIKNKNYSALCILLIVLMSSIGSDAVA